MASSLTTSGFRPPFWPYRVGTSQQTNTINGSLFQDSDTFFNGEIPSISSIDGGLFEDSDSLFQGVVANRNQIDGSTIGAFLEVLASTTSKNETSQISHTVNLPDGVKDIGRTVLVAIAGGDICTFSFPAGWTELFDSSTTGVTLGIGYRVIDGTEGFTTTNSTITVTTSTGKVTSHISYLISNVESSEIEINTSVTGMNTSPNPGSITPSGGYNSYLTLAIQAHDVGVTTTTGFPSGYGNTQNITSGGLLRGCGIGAAQLIETNSSQDPGAFTIDQVRDWIAVTVSIRDAITSRENTFFQGAMSAPMDGSLLANTNTLNRGSIYFGSRVSSSQLGISGTSEDPGVYTLSESRDWIALTVSVKGG